MFETAPRRDLVSASTVVVSALVAERALYPGGNDGDGWLSSTIRVSTGSRVAIEDLFARSRAGLRVLASVARTRLLAADACARRSQDSFTRAAFVPTARHYRNFALTARGLAVGFGIGDVGGVWCGRLMTVVPYAVLRPYLSKLGAALVAGVRAPLS